jgi:hypothetical protein
MFGAKRDEVAGGWRKQHNEELRNLYSSPSITRIKEDEMDIVYSTNWEEDECI